jgi:predicted membrane-bound spermidine synthase
VLALQLALTRLFSATMHYHFAFLAISLALFGSGAAGVFVYAVDARLRRGSPARQLSACATLAALATPLALVVVLANPVSSQEAGLGVLARLAVVYTAAALPFFFAGCAITLAISRFAEQAGRLYLWDLTGAAAGCLLLIPALETLGATGTVLGAGGLSAAAGAVFAGSGPRARGAARGAWLAGVLLAALALENLASGRLDLRWAKGFAEDEGVLFSRWNSFSRVTVRGSLAEDRLLIQIDSDAAATLNRDGHRLDQHRHLGRSVEGLAYHLRPGARALIIGPGGGNDVVVARVLGARQVTAVEVNPIIAREVMSREPFRSYSGALYEQPGVRLVIDEGRSFLRRSPERYDVVQATMVDTWAATAAGAFALAENNLYTVEAFKEYLEHLEPDGVLSMTRWHLEPPDQLLRLVSLARAALDELGLGEAGPRLALVRGRPQRRFQRAPATFLLKRTPFSERELALLEQLSESSGFEPLYTPAVRPANDFTRLIEAERPELFFASHPTDVTPTRDNDPFFFHSLRLRDLGRALTGAGEWHKTNLGSFVLFSLLGLSALMTSLFILGPLVLTRARRREVAPRTRLSWLVYFALLGAGYILVEVALIQKCILFLGHPVYALTVVLFSILCFGGLGAALSARLPPRRLTRALPRMLAGLVVLILASIALLSPAFQALVRLELPLRIALCAAFLAPIGLALGMPMPSAIRILAQRAPGLIPWGWGVNGAASVLGSAGALTLAVYTGFDQTLLAAATLYTLALGVRPRALAIPQAETAASAARYLPSTTSQR